MKPTLLAAIAATAFALVNSQASASATANFVTLAGQPAVLSSVNGTTTSARFFAPQSVAVDSAGYVYVADTGDHTVREIDTSGNVYVLAGVSGSPGNIDGAQGTNRLDYPYAVAVDANRNVYVTDILDNTVRMITQAGTVTTIGSGFNNPEGVTVDSTGNIYVADTNNSVIKERVAGGSTFSVIAGTLGVNGATNATLNYPAGLAVDTAGNVYVADYDNSAIRMIAASSHSLTTIAGTIGSTGSANGTGTSASFNHPQAVSVDGSGNIYVVDTSNQLIREIASASSTTPYAVTTVAGTLNVIGSANGAPLTVATFFYPQGIAATSSGTLYVADTGNHSIREIVGGSTGTVSTYAGAVGVNGFANGSDLSASFSHPYGVAVSSSGTVYVADSGNNAIRMISGGVVSTLAGTGIAGAANGAASVATFNNPSGVAVDGSGNVYVADTGNNVIRKIAGGVVTTFVSGLNGPQGVAVDAAGDVFIADTNNDTIDEVLAGTTTVTVIAGATGQSGSTNATTGTSARFNKPNALVVDASGNIFVSDFDNFVIREIAATTRSTTTLAGAVGTPGLADGASTVARFNQTYGVAVDSSDNVYVTDTVNRVVRQITSSGYVTTVTGQDARFFYPEGIALDTSGNLYVADSDNNAIMEGAVVSAAATGLANHTVAVGGSATFTVISPVAGASYTWQYSTNGVTWSTVSNGGSSPSYSGATTSALTISGATSAMNGYEYRAVATVGATVTDGPAGTLYVGSVRLLNISSSGYVGTTSLTAGFIIGGTGTKGILVRGIGPSLANFGVTGVLSNPSLTLYTSTSTVQATNTVWGGTSQLTTIMNQVGAFTISASSLDSALYVGNLGTGSHTATVTSANGGTGEALVEVYDADTGTPTANLSNISTSAYVGTVNLVAGFVLGGTTSQTVLIRGVGPGLAPFGYTNVLGNVQLTVYDSNQNTIATNNGWSATQAQFLSTTFSNVGAFSLNVGSMDSAVVLTLAPGNYTAQVTSATPGATGMALVEIYVVP